MRNTVILVVVLVALAALAAVYYGGPGTPMPGSGQASAPQAEAAMPYDPHATSAAYKADSTSREIGAHMPEPPAAFEPPTRAWTVNPSIGPGERGLSGTTAGNHRQKGPNSRRTGGAGIG